MIRQHLSPKQVYRFWKPFYDGVPNDDFYYLYSRRDRAIHYKASRLGFAMFCNCGCLLAPDDLSQRVHPWLPWAAFEYCLQVQSRRRMRAHELVAVTTRTRTSLPSIFTQRPETRTRVRDFFSSHIRNPNTRRHEVTLRGSVHAGVTGVRCLSYIPERHSGRPSDLGRDGRVTTQTTTQTNCARCSRLPDVR